MSGTYERYRLIGDEDVSTIAGLLAAADRHEREAHPPQGVQ